MNILLAVDGSEASSLAAKAITERPWPRGSQIRVLSVVEDGGPPPVAEAMLGTDAIMWKQQRTQDAEILTRNYAEAIERSKLPVQTAVRDGNPEDGIVDEAKEWPADLIVMGSHGYTGLKRLILGSVALSVVSHAPCSVEVVRPREEDTDKAESKAESKTEGKAKTERRKARATA